MSVRLGGRVPLIGGWRRHRADAYAKIRAGAAAVQLYTALIYQGPGVVRRIVDQLGAFLARDGFDQIGQAVGLTPPRSPTPALTRTAASPKTVASVEI